RIVGPGESPDITATMRSQRPGSNLVGEVPLSGGDDGSQEACDGTESRRRQQNNHPDPAGFSRRKQNEADTEANPGECQNGQPARGQILPPAFFSFPGFAHDGSIPSRLNSHLIFPSNKIQNSTLGVETKSRGSPRNTSMLFHDSMRKFL
ncbi:MAG TPA: hypothetical protein VGH65_11320, partial [Verrucomicrobiaceae bacterium]